MGHGPVGRGETVGDGGVDIDAAPFGQQAVIDRDDAEAVARQMGVQPVVQPGAAQNPAAAVNVQHHGAGRTFGPQDAQGNGRLAVGLADFDGDAALAQAGNGDGPGGRVQPQGQALARLDPPGVGPQTRGAGQDGVDPPHRRLLGRGKVDDMGGKGHEAGVGKGGFGFKGGGSEGLVSRKKPG